MSVLEHSLYLLLGLLLILSSLGILFARQPIYASLSFLLTLLLLAFLYLQLAAPFIAVMQILVYAGAILVIFMFVIILFQDAYQKISQLKAHSSSILLLTAGALFLISLIFLGFHLPPFTASLKEQPADYGTVQALGRALYLNFFFPFEAMMLLFLVAIVGAVYIGRKT